jgi:hypothetical protein
MQEKQKVCPLLIIASPNEGFNHNLCLKDDCAWYNTHCGECAMLNIPHMIDNFAMVFKEGANIFTREG